MTRRSLPLLTLFALLTASTAASAHLGHGTHTLAQGLAHPFGPDHLLAMVAVGLWSAAALPDARRWAGPATFMAALVVGAALGVAGLALPGTETGIALSVTVFGVMLAAGTRLAPRVGLGLIAAAALLHGLAHGAELPSGGSFAAYAAGFLATTAALHAAGLGLGERLRSARAAVWSSLGAAMGLAGLWLLVRV